MVINLSNYTELAFNKSAGLLPAIVQHALSGEVLMQAYMDLQAAKISLEQQRVTFFSRSQQRLWQKGETSGHILQLVSMHTDCDQDSILVQALPLGPACHLGTRSCFSDGQAVPMLQQLMDTINDRQASSDAQASYTAQLLAQGVQRCAQKVGEEGVEVALAAVTGDTDELLNESADLLYHLLVVLAARNLNINDVLAVLNERHQG